MGAYYIVKHVEIKTTKALIAADSAQAAYEYLNRGYYDEFDSDVTVDTHLTVKKADSTSEEQLLLKAPQEEDSDE
ncbi:hypothetical protein J7I81_12225 [Bacillus sp. ISL-32]|nr:hypothetical protein [Bacillus sp. ISL-32]